MCVETFNRVRHMTVLVICKTSLVFSIGVMECLLSMRCRVNLDFPFPYLKSRKSVEILFGKAFRSAQYIFFYSLDILIDKHHIY